MSTIDSSDVRTATDFLRGKAMTAADVLDLAKRLMDNEQAVGLARRILARACQTDVPPALRRRLTQKQALCTYKDPDLPVAQRLDRALEILESIEPLRTTHDKESLGQAGAIYKRKWEIESQKHQLERSLQYYLRGYESTADTDYGYNGINAAFVLDLLADLESREAMQAGATSDLSAARRQRAQRIRQDLVATLPTLPQRADSEWLQDKFWFPVTIAEAYFGLEQYRDAQVWLDRARRLERTPTWELESAVRQLSALARLHGVNLSAGTPPAEGTKERDAWDALMVLAQDAHGVRSAMIGRVGLGLSGGGFRASLFHIGVLARLAELDMLRHVEALSCVSGGSIIGAHYYLKLRQLLEEKRDSDITAADYVRIVRETADEFLAGVQANVRTRVAGEFATNLRMIFSPSYSRTARIGELFEEEIFSKAMGGNRQQPLWLNELRIQPKGAPASFVPKHDNWRRAAKVPTLILNAATLNTGHSWQFTAAWMGESPASIDAEIDGNYRLRRMYYGDAPSPHQRVRLGHAVAASACVPGLFEPIVFDDLYPERSASQPPAEIGDDALTVRLVDGGVHDNQGVVGLLEQDCSVLLVSDASGQMGTENQPGRGMLSVPLRTTSILQARVRSAQYRDLRARRRSSLLRGLMFVHLRKDLEVEPVDWIGCQDPPDALDDAQPADRRGPLTRYGIRKDVQRRLAAIRTDLDSFCDAEAYALMASGYRMTEYEVAQSIRDIPAPVPLDRSWPFLQIEEPLRETRIRDSDEPHRRLMRLLDVAAASGFKIWQLNRGLRYLAIALGIVAAVLLVWAGWTYRTVSLVTVGGIGTTLAVLLLSIIVGKTVMGIARYRDTLAKIGAGIGMALVGSLAAKLHLVLFDRWYLRQGTVAKIVGTPAEQMTAAGVPVVRDERRASTPGGGGA